MLTSEPDSRLKSADMMKRLTNPTEVGQLHYVIKIDNTYQRS